MQLFITYLLALLPFHDSPQPIQPPALDLAVDSCGGTFLKVFGDAGTPEFSHSILLMPDGNLLVGGSKGGASLLMLITQGGDVIWSKTFEFTPGEEFIFDMMLDSDGKLLVSGRDQLNTTNDSYYFKYDLATHTIIWAKSFPTSFARLETLLEKSPGGNYFLLGMVNDNNMFLELERNTGNTVIMKQYDFGQTDFFLTGKVRNGAIYTSGVQRNGGLGAIRASISKLSLTGDQLWTRFYFNGLNEIARTYFYENQLENDTLVCYGRGDLDGDSFTDGEILLMKANLDGDMLWAKRYNMPSSNTEFSGSFIPIPDGYIFQGNHILNSNGSSEFFIMRVNKQGDLIWAKSIRNIQGDWGKYAVQTGGFIYFIGRTNELDADGDLLFGRMSLDGELSGFNCSYVTDLVVEVNNVSNDYDNPHDLSSISSSYTSTNASVSPLNVQLDPLFFPGCECEEIIPLDTCPTGISVHTAPDVVLESISATCLNGVPVLTTLLCNIDSVDLPANTPISFYLGNPTTIAANLLATELINVAIPPGGCLEFEGPLALPTNQQIYAIANDNGTTPTPFSLVSDFPNTGINECDYTNNLNSFFIENNSPALDLGPDISACVFDGTLLDAGQGFISYQWSNGSTSQSITVGQPGTYGVTVTDACGGTQSDEVVLYLPPNVPVDIGYDAVQICVGSSFAFVLDGSFQSYQWSPADLVSCPDCPAVTVSPSTDTCFVVQAVDVEGCQSADTICVELVTDTAFILQTARICEGDSFAFFGQNITLPGQYQNINPNGNCVDVTTLTLSYHDDPTVVFAVDPPCPLAFDGSITAMPASGSVTPFSYTWEIDTVTTNQLTGLDVGTFALTITDGHGCTAIDSVEMQAVQRPSVSSEATPATCFGDNDGTVTFLTDDPSLRYYLLEPTPSSQTFYDSLYPGGYEYRILDTFGCVWRQYFNIDSPDRIKIELPSRVDAPFCEAAQISASTNLTPAIFAWSPADFLSCTDCPNPVASPFDPTTYYLTVSDAIGCSAMDSVRVTTDFDGRVYVPNAFSPNGDGINDYFFVQASCVEEVRLLRIFDRWGGHVFEANHTPPNIETEGWDGIFRDKDEDSNVFVYYIIVTLRDGSEIELEGGVTLLR